MIRIFLIKFIAIVSVPMALAASTEKVELVKTCTTTMEEVHKHIKPGCKWENLPDTHPRSHLCSVSCSHDDGHLKPGEFPFRLEEVSCGAGPEACTKDPKPCLEAQKKDDVETCKVKVEEKWLADPSMSVEAIKAMESGINSK